MAVCDGARSGEAAHPVKGSAGIQVADGRGVIAGLWATGGRPQQQPRKSSDDGQQEAARQSYLLKILQRFCPVSGDQHPCGHHDCIDQSDEKHDGGECKALRTPLEPELRLGC